MRSQTKLADAKGSRDGEGYALYPVVSDGTSVKNRTPASKSNDMPEISCTTYIAARKKGDVTQMVIPGRGGARIELMPD